MASQIVSTQLIKSGPPSGNSALALPGYYATTQQDEIITAKKVQQTTTKHTETRVRRQVVLEDGEIVEDSGPTVTQETKENTTTQEHEEKENKSRGGKPPGEGWKQVGEATVVSEKTERKKNTHEEKQERVETQENRHLGDISNEDIIRAIKEKGDLRMVLANKRDSQQHPSSELKLLHHSAKHKKIIDTEDINEISKNKGGEIVTETTKVTGREEYEQDEVPEGDEPIEPENKSASHNLKHVKDENFVEYVKVPQGGKIGDGVKIGEGMRYVQENVEEDRTGDGREFENNVLKLRNQRMRWHLPGRDDSPERKDALTKQPLDLDEEEETRKLETSKWLDHHFGSEDSYEGESSGNVVKIRTTLATDKRRKEAETEAMYSKVNKPITVKTDMNGHGLGYTVTSPKSPLSPMSSGEREKSTFFQGVSDWRSQQETHTESKNLRSVSKFDEIDSKSPLKSSFGSPDYKSTPRRTWERPQKIAFDDNIQYEKSSSSYQDLRTRSPPVPPKPTLTSTVLRSQSFSPSSRTTTLQQNAQKTWIKTSPKKQSPLRDEYNKIVKEMNGTNVTRSNKFEKWYESGTKSPVPPPKPERQRSPVNDRIPYHGSHTKESKYDSYRTSDYSSGSYGSSPPIRPPRTKKNITINSERKGYTTVANINGYKEHSSSYKEHNSSSRHRGHKESTYNPDSYSRPANSYYLGEDPFAGKRLFGTSGPQIYDSTKNKKNSHSAHHVTTLKAKVNDYTHFEDTHTLDRHYKGRVSEEKEYDPDRPTTLPRKHRSSSESPTQQFLYGEDNKTHLDYSSRDKSKSFLDTSTKDRSANESRVIGGSMWNIPLRQDVSKVESSMESSRTSRDFGSRLDSSKIDSSFSKYSTLNRHESSKDKTDRIRPSVNRSQSFNVAQRKQSSPVIVQPAFNPLRRTNSSLLQLNDSSPLSAPQIINNIRRSNSFKQEDTSPEERRLFTFEKKESKLNSILNGSRPKSPTSPTAKAPTTHSVHFADTVRTSKEADEDTAKRKSFLAGLISADVPKLPTETKEKSPPRSPPGVIPKSPPMPRSRLFEQNPTKPVRSKHLATPLQKVKLTQHTDDGISRSTPNLNSKIHSMVQPGGRVTTTRHGRSSLQYSTNFRSSDSLNQTHETTAKIVPLSSAPKFPVITKTFPTTPASAEIVKKTSRNEGYRKSSSESATKYVEGGSAPHRTGTGGVMIEVRDWNSRK